MFNQSIMRSNPVFYYVTQTPNINKRYIVIYFSSLFCSVSPPCLTTGREQGSHDLLTDSIMKAFLKSLNQKICKHMKKLSHSPLH